MQIIDHVTWLEALLGGGIIGLASAFLLFSNGKIAGISGIVGGLFTPKSGDVQWRILFIIGLIFGGLVTTLLAPQNTMLDFDPSTGRVIIAGVLVGVGTTLGSGCTSGHGVCGISRFSKRSIIATVTFMLTGFLTLWLGA